MGRWFAKFRPAFGAEPRLIAAQESPLRHLVRGLSQAIWTSDENGLAIEDSKSWREFTGQTWEEFRGSGWLSAIHPEDQTGVMRRWMSSVESKALFETEFRLKRADGAYQWTSVRAVPLAADGTGQKGWIGINVDISARKQAEENAKDRERTLTSIVMNSPSALSLKDLEGRYVIANPNFDSILGMNSQEMIGKTDYALFPTSVAEQLRANDQKVVVTASRMSVEEEIPNRDGQIRSFRAYKFPILDLDGRVVFVCSISLDVTDNKRSAQALRESEARTQQMVTSIPQLVWTCLPDGQCNYLSPQWIDYTGISSKDQLGLDWLTKVIHPEDQERTLKHWMGAVAGHHPYDIEYRIKRSDGVFQWFKTRGTPIRDANGKITDWFGTCTNIDEDIRLRGQLERREEEFRTIANSIPQLAWMAHRDGSIFWYNQRWFDYTGTTMEEMSGWGWQKVHDPKLLAGVIERWQQALASGSSWEDTFPLLGKNGTWRWFLSRALPVFDQNRKVQFWFGSNTDITENLQSERDLKESKDVAEKANLAKTQFLANISHEIRTPIGAIMGFTELLKDEAASPSERSRYMQIIERNSEGLLRLIDDILDLTKVEAGKISLEKSEFSIPDFLTDFASVMALKSQEKGVSFILQIKGFIPERVKTDPLRLKQILSNVVGNAIKFTDHGSVNLTVTFEAPVLRFTVTDTGPGIAEENVAQLFKPFGQVDPSMNRKYGGSGLGLILSKRLSQELGGDLILLNTAPEEGSTFMATISPELKADGPLIQPTRAAISEEISVDERNNKGRLSQLNVLVVDDSPDNRTLLEIYLGKTGAKIEMAKDGIEAVEKAMNLRPDVILMDIQMPRLDGHQATRKLRSLGFTKPIVALTAHAMREERDKCFESGCNDYLTKPLQRDRLIEVLSRYLPDKNIRA